ncbi:hypothetical protein LAZ67_15000492, partial [Cordylochernes scorpioides]
MLDDENTTIQELEKEQDLVKQYENNFLRTEKKVNEYLNPKGNDQHYQGDVASIRSSPEKSTSCRLPKIALKVHDGTSLEWLGWWSQFEAIHENPSLSEVDKFHYLIQSMKVGTRSERLVKSYPLTEANYPKVIEALRDRFGDKFPASNEYSVSRNWDPNDREITSPKDPPAPINGQEVEFAEMHERTAIPKALLATALIRIVNPHGNGVLARALLDQGSQSSFIQRDLLQHLNVPTCGVNAQVYGINNTKGELIEELASFTLESLTEPGWTLPMEALVVGRMTGLLPTKDLCLDIRSSWKVLPLADPQFEKCGKVDVILGADVYGRLLLPDLRLCDRTHQRKIAFWSRKYGFPSTFCGNLSKNTSSNTRLGWVLSGELPKGDQTSPHLVYNIRVKYEDHLDKLLQRFWEIEEIPSRPTESEEDEFCRNLYKREVQRTPGGRYIVPLPFNPKIPSENLFGKSFPTCVQRQLALERRLVRDAPLREEYCSFMRDYVELGHMTPLSEFSAIDTEGCCFIPHHAVRGNQTDKRKLRVVFDASTKTSSGWSLNDRLYTGPKLQTDILTILINWRRHKVVMLADIEKMYRQIMVRPQDAKRQRILRRESPDDRLKPYQLNTVTYGTSPAPFLALQTLLQLARDDEEKYPRAAEVIRAETYVDDIITGAENSVEALSLQKELIGLLKGGGFFLNKWASNDPVILNQIPEESRLQKIMFENVEVVKALGLGWNPREDSFIYDLQDPNTTEEITKRQMHSFVARLYDPIGWLAPVVIIGKIFIQKLWVTGAKWDESLDGYIRELWRKFHIHFLGTTRQLRLEFYMARDQMSEIAEIFANDGTEWKFNPPGAPHFGGLWEAGIKCFKYHFRRILGETLLTYEELLTLIVQIEYCLNSRPLGPISSDPNYLVALTPAHFLLTSQSYCAPEEDLLNVGVQLLPRWKMVQKM